MFKIVCEKCGVENKIGLVLDSIDTDGNIVLAIGDCTIDYIECECGNKIEGA